MRTKAWCQQTCTSNKVFMCSTSVKFLTRTRHWLKCSIKAKLPAFREWTHFCIFKSCHMKSFLNKGKVWLSNGYNLFLTKWFQNFLGTLPIHCLYPWIFIKTRVVTTTIYRHNSSAQKQTKRNLAFTWTLLHKWCLNNSTLNIQVPHTKGFDFRW